MTTTTPSNTAPTFVILVSREVSIGRLPLLMGTVFQPPSSTSGRPRPGTKRRAYCNNEYLLAPLSAGAASRPPSSDPQFHHVVSVAQTRGTNKKSSVESLTPHPDPLLNLSLRLTNGWAWRAAPTLVAALGHQLLHFYVFPVLFHLSLLMDLVNGLGTLVPTAWHPIALWGQKASHKVIISESQTKQCWELGAIAYR